MADKRISDFATVVELNEEDKLLIATDDDTYNVSADTLAKYCIGKMQLEVDEAAEGAVNVAILNQRIDQCIKSTNEGTREELLWSGDATYEGAVLQLAHPANTYDYLDITYGYVGSMSTVRIGARNRNNVLRGTNLPDSAEASPYLKVGEMGIVTANDYNSITINLASACTVNANGIQPLSRYASAEDAQTGNYGAGHIYKIMGVKIKAPDNAEVLDIRNMYNGDIASSAGEAVRRSMNIIANTLDACTLTIEEIARRLMVKTDNLIDTRTAAFWQSGSYLESDAQALYVHSAPIPVTPGTTLYLGGEDASTNIRSITVLDLNDQGSVLTTKQKMITDEWGHSQITVTGSQIVVNVGIKSGVGGITPNKMAEIAPQLYVSNVLYDENTYDYYEEAVGAEEVLNVARQAGIEARAAQANATRNTQAIEEIIDRLDENDENVNELETRLATQDQLNTANGNRIATCEQKIDNMGDQMGAVEETLLDHVQAVASIKERMKTRTDNLIDVSDPDFWQNGSYLETDAQALYVHSAPIAVIPGTTLYLGGADTAEKIRSITVFDIESGEIVETKTKMISEEWSHNTITVSGSQIIVDIGMVSGLGGLTPDKLAEIAPQLFVSPTLYTADTYEPHDKDVSLGEVLAVAKQADASVAIAQEQMATLQAQMQQTRQMVEECLYVETDNLIDTTDEDFWQVGSYLETDTHVLYVHSGPISVTPGTTLYLGGADESTNIRSITVFDVESGDPPPSKMKMITTEWSNSQITVQGSQIVVNVGIKSGVGGITPAKMAEIAPQLYVSPTLYTIDTYMAHNEIVDMGQLLTMSRTATAQVNAMQAQVATVTTQASDAAIQASSAATQAAQAAQAANAAAARINTAVTWSDVLKRTPLQCRVSTTEAKCLAVSGDMLFVNGALKLEKYRILYGGSALELLKSAWPLSGRNMRCYQMAAHSGGDYIFTANRLRSPGYTGEAVAGWLQVIDTADCQVKWEVSYDAKATGLEYYPDKQLLAVNLQVGGWVLYDVADPLNPIEKYRHTEAAGQEANEWQKGEFVETADHLYYVVCGFSDGIRLYEIDKSNYSNVTLVQLLRPRTWDNDLTDAHVFDVTVKYPYAYCTIAPLTYAVNQDGAPYGALTIDMRQLDNPIYHFEPIPVDDINTYLASDAQPSEIIRIDDRLIVNNGNKGVGIFDIDPDNPLHTIWRGNIPCGGDEVHSLEQDPNRGLLFVGCAFGDAPYNLRVFRGV